LPLAEALASGVPVICSDIPVFREVGRDVPDYVDPLDLFAWRDAIVDYSDPDSPRRAAQLQRLGHWQPPRWPEHFEIVERALDRVTRSSSASS
jgi:glycosyltransferase involved in cell wall biosynthesis